MRKRPNITLAALAGVGLLQLAPGGFGAEDTSAPAATRAPIVFAFMLNPGEAEIEGILLADSLRTFGGSMRGAEIRAYAPKTIAGIREASRNRLTALNVRIVPFSVDDQPLAFPLAAKVYAAAKAEADAAEQAEFLAWLDSDTFILREPAAWLLPKDKSLAYRPVMHVLIGSPADATVDPFWEFIYDRCGVSEERIFPMTTPVDGVRIRPYFNAGMLIVRPERGVLRSWRENFDRLFRDPFLQPYYKKDARYAVFVHQAVLAGTILHAFAPEELIECPPAYNYSLQLHARYPESRRIRALDETITARYDDYTHLSNSSEWRTMIELGETFKKWLADGLRGSNP